jgi:hypothetical protein
MRQTILGRDDWASPFRRFHGVVYRLPDAAERYRGFELMLDSGGV